MSTLQPPTPPPPPWRMLKRSSRRVLVVGIVLISVVAYSFVYDRKLMATYSTTLASTRKDDSPRTAAAINRTTTTAASRLATRAFVAGGFDDTHGVGESALDLLVEEAAWEDEDEQQDETDDVGDDETSLTGSSTPTPATTRKNGFKFYILHVPNMTTALVEHDVERASRIYKDDINEASAEMWLHRGMASLSYEQGQTMDPSEADVFLIPGYLRLRAKTSSAEDNKVDMYQEVMNAVVNQSKPHIWMSPTENPGVCTNLGVTDLVKRLRVHLKDNLYALGLERNSAWSGGLNVERIIPVPYVLRPTVPYDHLASSFSHNRTENFVFFRADARRFAVEWAGCNRSSVIPLYDHPNMNVRLAGKGATTGRITQDEYNSLMSTSDYCLVMCGDTPTTRSLVSSVMAGCIPILVGRWWHGLCDPPCNRVWGWDVANLPHFPFADQIDWHLMPVANHSQFEKDPNATLMALFQQYPKHRKDRIRAEMKRVQKWLVYGWGDPVTSNIFGDAYPHVWESILHHVGLQSATKKATM